LGKYKDERRNDERTHAYMRIEACPLVVFIMFVKSFEFVSQDIIHTCVVRCADTD
jgi:hypothetical protein